jgi:enoyl-CoA hydratase/carnithine racemase
VSTVESEVEAQPPVLVRVDDRGLAIVTLNRPDRLNAWTHEMSALLSDSMAALDADDGVRAVVLTGAGRAFCAGADVGRFTSRDPNAPPARRPWTERTLPSQMVKPVVAAINGHAVGVGLSYAMHCDVRFVASDAKLGFVFNRRGMVPEVAISSLLPRLAGHGVAADLLLSGRIFSGDEAVGLGLASRALPAADVLPAAVAWAEDVIRGCNPASVGATKWLLAAWSRREDRQALAVEDALAVEFARRSGAQEGMRAFAEKREPTWSSSHREGVDLAADLDAQIGD